MAIPGGSFEKRLMGTERSQQKLAALGNEEAFEVRRLDIFGGRPFRHRRRVRRDAKSQTARLAPDFDRFDRNAGRKNTKAHGAPSGGGISFPGGGGQTPGGK